MALGLLMLYYEKCLPYSLPSDCARRPSSRRTGHSVGWPDGGLSNCVALYITDGDGVVITGQGQQILITPRPTGDPPRVLPQDRHLPVTHQNKTHLNTVFAVSIRTSYTVI